jgi:pimeloyl-ACP methyl ester carboxylesterase
VKGTSSFEDFLTDCCGRAVSLEDKISFQEVFEVSMSGPDAVDVTDSGVEVMSGHERIWMHSSCDSGARCHEGILLSARGLADKVSKLFQDFVIKKNYNCILCGHSLGAGVAALLGMLLRGRFPELESEYQHLRVYAFAPPPVLDYESSLAASSYILSIVNNSDAIPRFSLANVLIFLEFLRQVSQKLAERGLSPTSPATVPALLRKLLKGANDDDMIMTLEEVEEARESASRTVDKSDPCHLFIPGRVLILHDRREDADSCIDSSNDGQKYVDVYEAEGGCDVLRFFELDGLAPVSDHVCSAYAASLSRLGAMVRSNGTK